MAERREPQPKLASKRRPAAKTPEARENQLIAMAYDTAEEQMRSGTASAQVISHFLKLGSSREKIEQERIAMEVELAKAKREAMAAEARVEDLYANAIEAMRNYSGQDNYVSAEEDDEY